MSLTDKQGSVEADRVSKLESALAKAQVEIAGRIDNRAWLVGELRKHNSRRARLLEAAERHEQCCESLSFDVCEILADPALPEHEPAPERYDWHGHLPVPEDRRPYRHASAGGPESKCFTETHTVWHRQIGWHGQSGAFYSFDEDPSKHEPGSFSPVWLEVDSYPIEVPDDEMSTLEIGPVTPQMLADIAFVESIRNPNLDLPLDEDDELADINARVDADKRVLDAAEVLVARMKQAVGDSAFSASQWLDPDSYALFAAVDARRALTGEQKDGATAVCGHRNFDFPGITCTSVIGHPNLVSAATGNVWCHGDPERGHYWDEWPAAQCDSLNVHSGHVWDEPQPHWCVGLRAPNADGEELP